MANDPNTIQYVIQEDGFWYIASKDRTPGVPEITVSAKGIANGLSSIPNDGADFGPDSYDPSYSGSGVPYTQTSGIQEAYNYVNVNSDSYYNGTLVLFPDIYTISSTVTIPMNSNHIPPKTIGNGAMILTASTFPASDDMFNLITKTSGGMYKLYMDNIRFNPSSSAPPLNELNLSQSETDSAFYLSRIYTYIGTSSSGYGLITDGNEDIYIVGCQLDGNVSIKAVGGNATIVNSIIGSGSTQSSTFAGQLLLFEAVTFEGQYPPIFGQDVGDWSNITMNGVYNDGLTGTELYLIEGGSTTTHFNITLINNLLNGGVSYVFNNSTSTSVNVNIQIIGLVGGIEGSLANTGNLNVTYTVANITAPSLTLNSTVVTTPSVPASGTAQSNTNPYPVNVYLYGGTVTVIDYTPAGGSATQVGTSGPATVRLNPGDSITLTYSAAPTWNWVAV